MISTIVVVVLLLAVVGIGRKVGGDWVLIWTAVTGIGAFLALAALFAAAVYAREQFHESLRSSQIETDHAKEQLDEAKRAAGVAAANAEAQLVEAKRAAQAAQDFEKIRLTRDIFKEYLELTLKIESLYDTISFQEAKSRNDYEISSNYGDAIQLRKETADAVADCASLFAAGALAGEMFMRRAASWVLLAWYLYDRFLESYEIATGNRAINVSVLVWAAADYMKENQPQFYVTAPEIGQMTMPNPA